MKIVFMGLKGMPPRFGGLQFDAEEIGRRLVDRGHGVVVYCRRWYSGRTTEHRGMKLVMTPTLPWRPTDTIAHSFTSTIHALTSRPDVAHFFAYGSYFFVPFFRLFGIRTVIRLNGIPWENISYSRLAQLVQKSAVSIGMRFADAVTAESMPLKRRFEEDYGVPVTVTPVGATVREPLKPHLIKEKFGLDGGDYILFLGRMERGKRPDWIIKAFREAAPPGVKLVIAGDTKCLDYKDEVAELAGQDGSVIIPGYVNGDLKEELMSNCRLFVLPSVSEGMPTSIMEAMGYGRCCLVSDIAPHRWLIEDGKEGFLFDAGSYADFSESLSRVLALPDGEIRKRGGEARKSVAVRFDWDEIVRLIEAVYDGTHTTGGGA